MDFGGILVPCSDNNNNTATTTTITTNALFSASSEAVSDAETKQKWHGSVGYLKQQANHATEDDMRDSKMAKTTAASLPRSPFLGSDAQQMLCFSSPYYHPAASFGGNSGYGITGLNGANMHGLKGPFTPSQWMELEHQALIYKYITANVQIPPYLLNPIRKAIESAALSTFGLRATSLGWGGFHLGFSNSTDPEPGRCRRTDGKKWRCSKDAVADQKYCERHMNRGRHRSRKPVEPPSGPTAAAKLSMPATSSTPSAADVSVGFSHHNHLSNLQLPASHLDRSFSDKEYAGERYQDPTGLTITSSILKDRQYSMPKEQNPCEESQHPIRQFMDDWPKNQSDRSMVGWPEMQQSSDSTQLSISIPVATSEFMSSTPANEKLSREIEATQMRLGVGNVINEQNPRQGNWIPIPWEPSMGGPLGEVFHGTNSSPKPASSPTGVLQKAVFYSASNSSAGSSPRVESYSILGPTLMNPSSLPAL